MVERPAGRGEGQDCPLWYGFCLASRRLPSRYLAAWWPR
jgi:hypothetical protein